MIKRSAGFSLLFALVLLGASSIATLAQPIRDVTPQGVTRVCRHDSLTASREPKEPFGPMRVHADGTLSAPSGPLRL